MNPKEKSLRDIFENSHNFCLKCQGFSKCHMQCNKYESDLLSAIQAHIDSEIRVTRAHQEMETYCAMEKKYKSRRLSKVEIENAIDIWIHENKLGNYDKIPRIKEYDKLAHVIYEAQEKKDK